LTNIILDLDTGIDDAMALAIAIIDPEINILGISTTYGNVVTTKSCVNTKYLLDLFHRDDIPVVKGLDHALDAKDFFPDEISREIHGEDGLANLNLNVKEYKEEDYEYFVPFYLRMIDKYHDDITIVTTGPLTNTAYLLETHPEEMRHVSKIVSMGGAIIFPGNINNGVEANINQDPRSAKIVMECGIHNTIVPLDVTEKSRTLRSDLKKWREHNTEISSLYADLVDYYIDQHPMKDECYNHDPLAVIYCSHSDCFTTIDLNCTVLLDECPGRIVGNLDKIRDHRKDTTLCLDVDADKIDQFINDSYNDYFDGISKK
jgi:purine nucleosidase